MSQNKRPHCVNLAKLQCMARSVDNGLCICEASSPFSQLAVQQAGWFSPHLRGGTASVRKSPWRWQSLPPTPQFLPKKYI